MVVLNNKILFCIVTFRERYWECQTFKSLVDSYNEFKVDDEINIFVFDNTDFQDWSLIHPNIKNEIKLEYFCLNENFGISKAYNKMYEFAFENNFKWMVFLDQDTYLPNNFYQIYVNKALADNTNYPIAIPIIYSDNKILSPAKYFFYRSFEIKEIRRKCLNLKNISCINSGLMVELSLFKTVNGYDEALKLDFCDHDFIDRIKKELNSIEILDVQLVQNFSLETNTIEKAIFRYKMFIQDLKAYSRQRNKILLLILIDLPHLIRLTLKYKSAKFVFVRFGVNIFK